MIPETTLARFQANAETEMRNVCTINAPGSSSGGLDPDTWLETVTPGSLLYSGRCKVRVPGGAATGQNREVVGDRVYITQPVLSIPAASPRIPPESVVAITGPAGHTLVGRRYRVIGQVDGTAMTAQRMLVEAVS